MIAKYRIIPNLVILTLLASILQGAGRPNNVIIMDCEHAMIAHLIPAYNDIVHRLYRVAKFGTKMR